MTHSKEATSTIIYAVMLILSAVFLITGVCAGDPATLLPGLRAIFTTPAILYTDFIAVGGLNAALFNAGLMGLFAWTLLKVSGYHATGSCFGAFFLSLGLGLFGKTALSVSPIIFGSWIYAKYKREAFSRVVLYALQGGALAPVVSLLIFGRGAAPSVSTWLLGALAGMTIGFFISPMAIYTRSIHRGYSLFNVAMATGFMGIAIYALFHSLILPEDHGISTLLSESRALFFTLFLVGIFLAFVVAGWLLNGRSFKNYGRLRWHTGLYVDFAYEFGIPNVLLNIGLVGFIMLIYFWLIGASFNGVTVGALLCTLCWTGIGTNTRTLIPILLGYGLASLLSGIPMNAIWLCTGVCLASGLAPISGRFGGLSGILAGAVHAFLMGITATMQGGLNLYNGGFAAGLTVILLYPILHTLVRHEYADDVETERHPGIVEELALDAAHIVEGVGEGITQGNAHDHRLSKVQETMLAIRNVLVILAGILFLLSLLRKGNIAAYSYILKFVAYSMGAGAYTSEILLLTDVFRKNPSLKTMLMPYTFGALYVILGISYLLRY